MVWAGVGAGVWAGAWAPLCPHVHKEVLPKRNPNNQKEQRTKNEHENKSRYFWGGIQRVRGSFWAVSSIGGTFSEVNRHITGTAHQGGNFTAGKIPTTALNPERHLFVFQSFKFSIQQNVEIEVSKRFLLYAGDLFFFNWSNISRNIRGFVNNS